MKRVALAISAALFFVIVAATLLKTTGSRADERPVAPSHDQWEYLVLAGGTVNLTPSPNRSLRKEPTGSFREAFALETNLDKLGAEGWELVSVSGPPGDPVFFLKRHK